MTRLTACLLATLFLALGVTGRACAAESFDNCTGTILTLPATITTQGTWCVKQNLSTLINSGAAITVNTNNVTIDCNGFQVSGQLAGTATNANGIYATSRSNITVRHCDLRGFYYGILLSGSTGGHTVEYNRFASNTFAGMYIQGDGSVVQHNLIVNTGGTTQAADAAGILAFHSVDIIDNRIFGVTATSGATGSAYGIYTDSEVNGRIIGNDVGGLVKDSSGVDYGILNTTSGHIAVRKNYVFGDSSATTSTGIFCANSSGGARDNVISAFVTGIDTCTDSGGNDIAP